jgi:hypothetical protein
VPAAFQKFIDDEGFETPALDPVDGAVGADVLTLRLAAEKVEHVTGVAMRVPSIAADRSPVLERRAEVVYASNRVAVTIDTGKMTWVGGAEKQSFRTYEGAEKQGAFLRSVKIVNADGYTVGSAPMTMADGTQVNMWFAEAPRSSDTPTRYGLVEAASALMRQYNADSGSREKCIVPATQVDWSAQMPEIVAANSDILQSAEQQVRFAVDYTGARAAASTSMGMRAVDLSPPVVFGANGPVMYWIAEEDGVVPFAVTRTSGEAWLRMDQQPDFDFEATDDSSRPSLGGRDY